MDIPAEKLTHVNYAFGLIGADGRAVLGDPAADIGRADPGDGPDADQLAGNFRQLRLLKERHPHLQTLISMGGWTGSGPFSDAVATEQRRRDFVASCVELFLTRWPGVFDGIDIDWEYPVCCGLPENSYRPEDRRNCTLLFAELRRQLDQLGASTGRRYLLTAAIPAGRDLPATCFELREAAQILDWINVMTYDMNGSERSGITNFNAAFRESPSDPRPPETERDWNVEGTVQAFHDEGVPRRAARRRRAVLRSRLHRRPRCRRRSLPAIHRDHLGATTTRSRRNTCRSPNGSGIRRPRCPGCTIRKAAG